MEHLLPIAQQSKATGREGGSIVANNLLDFQVFHKFYAMVGDAHIYI
jgi:hypothetical protein